MWTWEIFRCCSWLSSVVYLHSGDVLVIHAQAAHRTAQCALIQTHWLPLLGMKTRETQAQMLWDHFVEVSFEKPNLLQPVKPASYQHYHRVAAAMHIHTSTAFS